MPPLEVGVAVNVTVCPEQMVVVPEGEIVTAGVSELLVVMLVVAEVAVDGLAQGKFEVITQYTVELLFNATVV